MQACCINTSKHCYTELLKPYQSTEAPTPSIPDSTTASKPNTTTAAKPATKPATTAKKPNTTATKVKLAKQTTKVKANGKKKIKVSWKKDKKASGYEITYSTKKSFKGKKTIVVRWGALLFCFLLPMWFHSFMTIFRMVLQILPPSTLFPDRSDRMSRLYALAH